MTKSTIIASNAKIEAATPSSPEPVWACPGKRTNLVLLIPIYEDWESVAILLETLDLQLAQANLRARVVIVDDGSQTRANSRLGAVESTLGSSLEKVEILRLQRNLGHQRAIAIGLCHVTRSIETDSVVVMDGDGEDAPSDVPRLIGAMRKHQDAGVVFAERRRRCESFTFQVLYHCYRGLHRLLTGIPVRVGNFSVIPAHCLPRLTLMPDLWNHYAASVFRAGLKYFLVPTHRSPRLAGRSHMNFVSLVTHGLSALSVHRDLIGVRLLVAVGGGTLLLVALLIGIFAVRSFSGIVLPVWSTVIGGFVLLAALQLLTATAMFAIIVLGNRSNLGFIPIRDYSLFIESLSTVYSRVAR